MRPAKIRMKREIAVLLAVIFALALVIRFAPMSTHEHPIGVDAYYHFRQAEAFKNGFVFYDNLSFGGRAYVYEPTFHIFLAAVSAATFLPVETVAPIIVTLIGSLTVIVVFFITRRVSKNDSAALLSAALFAVVPVFVWKTASTTLLTSVDIFLLSLSLLFLLRRDEKQYIVTSVVLFLFSPAVGVLAMCLNAFYLRPKWTKTEYVWLAFLIVFVIFSLQFFQAFNSVYISKDIPADVQRSLNENIGLSDYLFRLNVFVIGLGALGLYLSRKRAKELLPLLLILIVMFVSLVSGFLETDRALVYLAVPLAVFAGVGAYELVKREKLMVLLLLAALAVSIFFGVIALGNLEWSAIPNSEYSALEWLRNNSPENSTILGTPVEGHWIAYVAVRKNVIDTHLLGAVNFTERFDDVMAMYRTDDRTLRERLFEKYDVAYVLYSDRFALSEFSIERFRSYQPVYQKGFTVVYKVM